MRDKIRQIVVQAIAGTTDLTEAIDQLCDLSNVSKCDTKKHEAYKKYDDDKYCKDCGKKL